MPPSSVAGKEAATDDVAGLPSNRRDVAIRDLRSGILDFMIINPGVYEVNKDAVNVMAVLSELEQASETYGGAPRVQDYDIELGMSGLAPMGWNWWLVRKDTPEDVVATLREAMGSALQREDVQQRLMDMGYVPTLYSPEEYEGVVGPVSEDLQSGIDAISWEEEQLKALDG